jgi:hypothetical protein
MFGGERKKAQLPAARGKQAPNRQQHHNAGAAGQLHLVVMPRLGTARQCLHPA